MFSAPRFSTKDPSLVLQNNLKMFFNISRCADHFGKMIYYGSGAEFGRENWNPKMQETYFDQNVPTDPYGLSKYIMTKRTFKNASPCCINRHGNSFFRFIKPRV